MLCQEIIMWLLQSTHLVVTFLGYLEKSLGPHCVWHPLTECGLLRKTQWRLSSWLDIWYNTTILLSHPLYSAAGFIALALYALSVYMIITSCSMTENKTHIHPAIFYHFTPAWGHGRVFLSLNDGLWYHSTGRLRWDTQHIQDLTFENESKGLSSAGCVNRYTLLSNMRVRLSLYSRCMWLNSCGSTVILLYKSDNVMMTPLIHKGGFEQRFFCTTVCYIFKTGSFMLSAALPFS